MMRALMYCLALVAVRPSEALACTCSGPRNATEAYLASAIFQGRVTRMEVRPGANGATPLDYVDPVEVELEVLRVWRGSVGSTVIITTGYGGGDCGFPFSVGEEYVVPGYFYEGRLSTGLCGGVQPVWEARATLGALGPGYTPELVWLVEDRASQTALPWERDLRRSSMVWPRLLFVYSALALVLLSALCAVLWVQDRAARHRQG